jgi:hypothetical protein
MRNPLPCHFATGAFAWLFVQVILRMSSYTDYDEELDEPGSIKEEVREMVWPQIVAKLKE